MKTEPMRFMIASARLLYIRKYGEEKAPQTKLRCYYVYLLSLDNRATANDIVTIV